MVPFYLEGADVADRLAVAVTVLGGGGRLVDLWQAVGGRCFLSEGTFVLIKTRMKSTLRPLDR